MEKVLTVDEFRYSQDMIGCFVEQAVVDNAINCMPPACERYDCTQLGEPYSHRQDPGTGKWKATYGTFKTVAGEWPNAVWQYCGDCFRGENIMRGKEPVYHKL